MAEQAVPVPTNLWALVEQQAADRPDGLLAVDEEGHTLTFGEFRAGIFQGLARGLQLRELLGHQLERLRRRRDPAAQGAEDPRPAGPFGPLAALAVHVKGPGVVPVLTESPGTIRYAGSARPGQHNDEVFTGLLGRSTGEIAQLQKEGVL